VVSAFGSAATFAWLDNVVASAVIDDRVTRLLESGTDVGGTSLRLLGGMIVCIMRRTRRFLFVAMNVVKR
jgi:hypothetical protein